MRDSIVFYRSYYEIIKELPDEQKLKVYEAIFEYGLNENEIELDGLIKAIFNLAKPNIDSANARYTASIENGKKGGRPKKENLEKPKNNLKTTQKQPKNNLNDNVNVNVNDNYNVNDNVVVKEKEKEKTTTTANNVWDFYLNNINSTPVENEIETIQDYEKELPSDLIIYAMKKAVENKARNLAYIKGILNKWQKKGITTLAEAELEKKEKPQEQTNRLRSDNIIDYSQYYV